MMKRSFVMMMMLPTGLAVRHQADREQLASDPPIYRTEANLKQLTENNCECLGECSTKISIGCFSAAVCGVNASCNSTKHDVEMSWPDDWAGKYDYCRFGEYTPYEKLTAKEKYTLIFNRIQQTPVSVALEYPSGLEIGVKLISESVRTSFEATSDIFPMKRTRVIHSVGAVASITWEASGYNNNYTGLFRTGAEFGLVRFSMAKDPNQRQGNGQFPNGLVPGVGVKLFRDGRPSANFVAMPSLTGQSCDERNFFKNNFTNHVPHPEQSDAALKLLVMKFTQASRAPLMVGLSELADDGSSDVNFPYKLVLHPKVEVDCDCGGYDSCLDNLGKLSRGTPLFDIYAYDDPMSTVGQYIGTVKIGEFPARKSEFGDKDLFFKHQYMEEDFAKRPRWLPMIGSKKLENCGTEEVSDSIPNKEDGCSVVFPGSKNPSPDYKIMLKKMLHTDGGER